MYRKSWLSRKAYDDDVTYVVYAVYVFICVICEDYIDIQ